jgi:hypothetical protein
MPSGTTLKLTPAFYLGAAVAHSGIAQSSPSQGDGMAAVAAAVAKFRQNHQQHSADSKTKYCTSV